MSGEVVLNFDLPDLTDFDLNMILLMIKINLSVKSKKSGKSKFKTYSLRQFQFFFSDAVSVEE